MIGVYWAVSGYAIYFIQDGSSSLGMVSDHSHYADYLNHLSRDFMDFIVRIPVSKPLSMNSDDAMLMMALTTYMFKVVLVGHYDYSLPEVQKAMENITRSIENSHPYLQNDLYTDSWLRGFLGFAKQTYDPEALSALENEQNFTTVLREASS
jgi:hypothetical protein